MSQICLIIEINHLKNFFVFCSFLLFANELMLLSMLMKGASQTSLLDILPDWWFNAVMKYFSDFVVWCDEFSFVHNYNMEENWVNHASPLTSY